MLIYHRILRYLFLSVAMGVTCLASPRGGLATAGMAEFMVDTPGGNQLGHCFRPHGGDISVCLFAGEADPNSELARGLRRWRYYEGFIVADVAGGFLLVDEKDKSVERFQSEKQLEAHLSTLPSAVVLTDWLTDKDAMDEIWYPLTGWGFCRWKQGKLQGSERLRSFYRSMQKEMDQTSDSLCQRVDDPKLQELRRRTTLGKACRKRTKVQSADSSRADPSLWEEIAQQFCDELIPTR